MAVKHLRILTLPGEDRGDLCKMVVIMPIIVGGDLKLGASGCPGLHVAQHGLKSLHVRGMSVR